MQQMGTSQKNDVELKYPGTKRTHSTKFNLHKIQKQTIYNV